MGACQSPLTSGFWPCVVLAEVPVWLWFAVHKALLSWYRPQFMYLNDRETYNRVIKACNIRDKMSSMVVN